VAKASNWRRSRTFKNEKERVEALNEWFGIEMLEEEKMGIRGMVTDLGDGIDFQM